MFIERPTSLQTRAITWVGRASNKVITKNSGLIDLLEQGDHLTDVPASTKGRKFTDRIREDVKFF